ncbi:MAG: hypothetical protein IH934_07595 [Nanoarchaeota archaeon]|nr:hypothetical protein [Nanoarchaeota archaeon]
MTQKRIILDTSVYGRLVSDKITLQNIEEKRESHRIVIYGTTIVRQELRGTPKHVTLEGKKLRILLLNIYDSLVTRHNLEFNKLIRTLSNDYFKAYRKEDGSLSNQEINNDLVIVATATIYNLDIIVSDDERSMLSDKAIRAYKKVNKEYGIKNPIFKKFNNFKEEIARRSFQYDT